MVTYSDLFSYTLVLIAIVALFINNKKKQPPRPEKTSSYFLANQLYQSNRLLLR